MEPVIVARDLTRHFGKTSAVQDVSFSLMPGRAYGLIGPNGAGKTTTLQMLIGLYPPTSGSATVFGFNPARAAESLEIRKRTGYVPEKHFIYRDMTAAQVLRFAGDIYPTWDRNESARVASLLGLPLATKVGALSRGELAKLALTIALAPKPELLLLDEPTSGLDPLVRHDFLDAIVGLIQRENRTVLFSSHIMGDIERVADTVLVMNEGRLIATEELDRLRRRFLRVSFLFDETPPADLQIPEARQVTKGTREWVVTLDRTGPDQVPSLAARIGARGLAEIKLSLEDVFLEMLGKKRDGGDA